VSEPACSLSTPLPEAEEAIRGLTTVAVVGLSPNPERPSHRVAAYLEEQGFTIIPIRPAISEILGRKAFASLTQYGQPVDIVDIFRKPEAVPAIVDEAIRLGCKVIWMQEGIAHAAAADKARTAGLTVVENRCLLKVHRSLTQPLK
jgi:uncharacterized protein